MPRRPGTILVLCSALCLFGAARSVQAGGFAPIHPTNVWDRIFAGTRSESMGQSDLAVSEGPMSIFDNPAPLPEGRDLQLGYGNMGYIASLELNHYAAAVEWGHFRLGYARMDVTSDDQLLRTAYNPEGNGETFRIDDRVMIYAGSVDIGGLLAPGSAWQWTVGASHREYRYAFASQITRMKGTDWGSSMRYRQQLGAARLIGSLAAVRRGSDDAELLSRDTRIGLGLSLELDAPRRPRLIVLTLAYLFKDIPDAEKNFSHRHYGAELTLLQTLSVRLGHDEQIYGGTDQFGIGVTVPRQWIQPFGLTVDWGAADTGTLRDMGATDKTSFNMVSVTGSYDF